MKKEVANKKPEGAVIGIVTDCKKLNVRKQPSINSAVICTVNAGSEVLIDDTNVTGEFYMVCTESGMEGFCMKKYISVPPSVKEDCDDGEHTKLD